MFGELGAHHPDLGLLSAGVDSTNYLGARIVIPISTMREDDQLGVNIPTDCKGVRRRQFGSDTYGSGHLTRLVTAH